MVTLVVGLAAYASIALFLSKKSKNSACFDRFYGNYGIRWVTDNARSLQSCLSKSTRKAQLAVATSWERGRKAVEANCQRRSCLLKQSWAEENKRTREAEHEFACIRPPFTFSALEWELFAAYLCKCINGKFVLCSARTYTDREIKTRRFLVHNRSDKRIIWQSFARLLSLLCFHHKLCNWAAHNLMRLQR